LLRSGGNCESRCGLHRFRPTGDITASVIDPTTKHIVVPLPRELFRETIAKAQNGVGLGQDRHISPYLTSLVDAYADSSANGKGTRRYRLLTPYFDRVVSRWIYEQRVTGVAVAMLRRFVKLPKIERVDLRTVNCTEQVNVTTTRREHVDSRIEVYNDNGIRKGSLKWE
jgi:hypothetical protein